MTRLMITLAAAAAGGVSMLADAGSGASGPGTSEITVFGTDPCPRSTDSQVYVCNRRPESRTLSAARRTSSFRARASSASPGRTRRRR